jgi:hypothetical protein
MNLIDMIARKRSQILKKWFAGIVETYPPETSQFLKTQTDPFANPVGRTIFEGMEGIFKILLEGKAPGEISPFLDRIVQIRAVQDFTPSQAVAFVFLLKKVLREVLKGELQTHHLQGDLMELETLVDELALQAFDRYMYYREKVFALKVEELHGRAVNLLERSNFLRVKPEEKPDQNVEARYP